MDHLVRWRQDVANKEQVLPAYENKKIYSDKWTKWKEKKKKRNLYICSNN